MGGHLDHNDSVSEHARRTVRKISSPDGASVIGVEICRQLVREPAPGRGLAISEDRGPRIPLCSRAAEIVVPTRVAESQNVRLLFF
jgi:hypothetical protein